MSRIHQRIDQREKCLAKAGSIVYNRYYMKQCNYSVDESYESLTFFQRADGWCESVKRRCQVHFRSCWRRVRRVVSYKIRMSDLSFKKDEVNWVATRIPFVPCNYVGEGTFFFPT